MTMQTQRQTRIRELYARIAVAKKGLELEPLAAEMAIYGGWSENLFWDYIDVLEKSGCLEVQRTGIKTAKAIKKPEN